MNARAKDPRRLDVAQLASDGLHLSGEWPLSELARLADFQVAGDAASVPVEWQAEGELRPVRGGTAAVWMQLRGHCAMALCCQRCLGPVDADVSFDRWFHFVPDEEQAALLDADSEDEVLALERWLDLQALVEDEMLLALPLVPRHDTCPEPLPRPVDDLEEAPEENPFAKLAGLRKGES